MASTYKAGSARSPDADAVLASLRGSRKLASLDYPVRRPNGDLMGRGGVAFARAVEGKRTRRTRSNSVQSTKQALVR